MSGAVLSGVPVGPGTPGVESPAPARDGPPFVRIHRSVIVNIGRVKEIQPWFQGDYVLILHNGKRLVSGRGYRDVARRLLARFGA